MYEVWVYESVSYYYSILSVRELRTLLVRLKGVPLTANIINSFEGVLKDCDVQYNHSSPSIDPLEYETHYDPDLVIRNNNGICMYLLTLSLSLPPPSLLSLSLSLSQPLLTLEFISNCTELVKMINKTFGSKNRFKSVAYTHSDGRGYHV